MGNVFERPSVQEGQPFTIFHNSKNLAASSQELGDDITETGENERERKREPLNALSQLRHFQSRSGTLDHTGGNLFSQWYDGVSENSQCPNGILDIFPDSTEFREQLDQLSFRANCSDFCAQKESFPFLNKKCAQHLSLDLIFSYFDISLSVFRCRNASEKRTFQNFLCLMNSEWVRSCVSFLW